jgi:hypothetical protein
MKIPEEEMNENINKFISDEIDRRVIAWIAEGQGQDFAEELARLARRVIEVEDALMFYADEQTYFAIGFLPDEPCGEFMGDTEHPGGKPGARARKVLGLDPKEG